MDLGVLDLGGRVSETLELAQRVEGLGYARFWIAEHQPQPTPLLVVSIVAGVTQRIRVGTGGVLLHHYSPWRVAHDFHFLERAYEGRIDAGVCAGFTVRVPDDERDDPTTTQRDYGSLVARFVRHLRNTPGDARFDQSTAWPGSLDEPPQVWSLGGGERSAALAALHGLHLGYSLLHANSVDDASCADGYRATYIPSRAQPTPRLGLAVCVVCAETTPRAEAIAATVSSEFFRARVVGDPSRCAEMLQTLAARYGADELIIADLCGDLAARTRCYELLASRML